MLKSHFSRLLI